MEISTTDKSTSNPSNANARLADHVPRNASPLRKSFRRKKSSFSSETIVTPRSTSVRMSSTDEDSSALKSKSMSEPYYSGSIAVLNSRSASDSVMDVDGKEENPSHGLNRFGSVRFGSTSGKNNRNSENLIPYSFSKDELMSNVIDRGEGGEIPAFKAAILANQSIHSTRVSKITNLTLSMKPKFKLKTSNKKKLFSKNFKGKVINGLHEQYSLSYGMMLGIFTSVTHSLIDPNKALTRADFEYAQKLRFPKNGSKVPGKETQPHALQHTFRFKAYAPKVFQKIRTVFSLEESDYMHSVTNYNYLEFMSNSKSGQFFFFSHDGKFMIKTQSKEENKFLKQILPAYYSYVVENPNTLLVHMLGMYRVKMNHLRRKVRFVIMNSVFDTPEKIHRIYDLKGSLIGREITKKEREKGGVFKDLDLINEKRFFHLGPKKAEFMKQIAKDAEFLAELNIMDYSLLIGIHDRLQRSESYIRAKHESVGLSAPVDASDFGRHSNTPFRETASREENGSFPSEAVMQGPIFDSADSLASDSKDAGVAVLDHLKLNGMEVVESETAEENTGAPKRNSPLMSKSHLLKVTDVAQTEYKNEILEVYEEEEEEEEEEDDEDDSSEDDGSSSGDESDSDFAPPEIKSSSTRSLRTSLFTHPALNSSLEIRRMETIISELSEKGRKKPWTSRPDGGINSRGMDSIQPGKSSIADFSARGNEIYYVGIIDILQQYNLRKKAENFFRGFLHDPSMISAVDPHTYANRFVKFLNENID